MMLTEEYMRQLKRMPFYITLENRLLTVWESKQPFAYIPTDDYYIVYGTSVFFTDKEGVLLQEYNGCGSKEDETVAEKLKNAAMGLYLVQLPLNAKQIMTITLFLQRYIENRCNQAARFMPMVVFYGTTPNREGELLPSAFLQFISRVEIPAINKFDLNTMVETELASYCCKAADSKFPVIDNEWYLTRIKRMGIGSIRMILRKIMNNDISHPGEQLLKYDTAEKCIVEEKNAQLLRHNKLVRYEVPDNVKVGAASNIEEWFNVHESSLKNPSVKHSPKGIFLVGVPGSGKSLIAKYAAKRLNIPLVLMDIGKILGKYVGESEHNMDEALEDLKYNAPCILWLDEVEKTFGNANSNSQGDGSGGVMDRLFAKLLTFMQENEEKIFIVMTANKLRNLPPEFVRSGRTDCKFKMLMPTWEECEAIFGFHVERACKKNGIDIFPGKSDKTEILEIITNLTDKSNALRYVTGADIEAIVKEMVILYKGKADWIEAAKGAMNYVTVSIDEAYPSSVKTAAENYLFMLGQPFLMASSGDKNPFADKVIDEKAVLQFPYGSERPCCMPKLEENFGGSEYDKRLYQLMAREMSDILAEKLSPAERLKYYEWWKQNKE